MHELLRVAAEIEGTPARRSVSPHFLSSLVECGRGTKMYGIHSYVTTKRGRDAQTERLTAGWQIYRPATCWTDLFAALQTVVTGVGAGKGRTSARRRAHFPSIYATSRVW